MESLAFGAHPARLIFSMRAGGERRECEAEAGFPQPPPGRSASPAPGPHSPLATAGPQERCCEAGYGGGALWLWRLGEMPQSQPASQTWPGRQVHTSDLPSTPQPAALLLQRASGSQETSRGVSEWPGILCKAQHAPTTVSRSAPACSCFTHSTHEAGLCSASPRQTRSLVLLGGGSPGVT